jgi:hypothetical protein
MLKAISLTTKYKANTALNTINPEIKPGDYRLNLTTENNS